MHILDIGCGPNKYEGREVIDTVIGLDMNDRFNPDEVFELVRGEKLPFDADSFDMVRASHFIEHVDYVPWAMEEIHRVGKPDAMVEIITPHFSAPSSYQDPTHRRHLSLKSMDYFDSTKAMYQCGYADVDFRIIKIEPRFRKNLQGIIRSIPSMLFGARIQERVFKGICPIAEIYFELKVVK